MNILLWIIQGITALLFGMAGSMKFSQSREKLLKTLPWVNDYSMTMVRFVGASELFAAIGLILPSALGIVPILTPVAACGLMLIMILAAVYHLGKKEYKGIMFNGLLFVLSAIIAYGRF